MWKQFRTQRKGISKRVERELEMEIKVEEMLRLGILRILIMVLKFYFVF